MIQLIESKKITKFMCIPFKGLNFVFKSISSHWGLDSTRNDLNIFTNSNKTFSFDLLGEESVDVYSQNKTRMTMPQLWKEFSFLECEDRTRCVGETCASTSFFMNKHLLPVMYFRCKGIAHCAS
jgi:hypothetical protein